MTTDDLAKVTDQGEGGSRADRRRAEGAGGAPQPLSATPSSTAGPACCCRGEGSLGRTPSGHARHRQGDPGPAARPSRRSVRHPLFRRRDSSSSPSTISERADPGQPARHPDPVRLPVRVAHGADQPDRRSRSRSIAAVMVLYRRGDTINTMVLAGLVIAVGEVVDDAIIDVENIWRRLRQTAAAGTPSLAPGHPRGVARGAERDPLRDPHHRARRSSRCSSSRADRAFFQPLAFSYGLAVLASMVVALTVTPALACCSSRARR